MACASFALPDAAVDADLAALCSGRHGQTRGYMVVVPLRPLADPPSRCTASSRSVARLRPIHGGMRRCSRRAARRQPRMPTVEPFTLLATICDEMAGDARLRDVQRRVPVAGSLVPQCKNYPPVPYAPTTREATDAVVSMCSTHGMVGCETCTSAAKCPHPARHALPDLPGHAVHGGLSSSSTRCATWFGAVRAAAATVRPRRR